MLLADCLLLFLAESPGRASRIAQTHGDAAGNFCTPNITAVRGFLLSGLPGHVLSTSFLTSKPTPPAQAMSSSRAGSSFRQRRNFVSLVDVHSQKQKERASQEQPFAEHNGEISWMAYRCNNLPLRQRTFGKKPPLYLSGNPIAGSFWRLATKSLWTLILTYFT